MPRGLQGIVDLIIWKVVSETVIRIGSDRASIRRGCSRRHTPKTEPTTLPVWMLTRQVHWIG